MFEIEQLISLLHQLQNPMENEDFKNKLERFEHRLLLALAQLEAKIDLSFDTIFTPNDWQTYQKILLAKSQFDSVANEKKIYLDQRISSSLSSISTSLREYCNRENLSILEEKYGLNSPEYNTVAEVGTLYYLDKIKSITPHIRSLALSNNLFEPYYIDKFIAISENFLEPAPDEIFKLADIIKAYLERRFNYLLTNGITNYACYKAAYLLNLQPYHAYFNTNNRFEVNTLNPYPTYNTLGYRDFDEITTTFFQTIPSPLELSQEHLNDPILFGYYLIWWMSNLLNTNEETPDVIVSQLQRVLYTPLATLADTEGNPRTFTQAKPGNYGLLLLELTLLHYQVMCSPPLSQERFQGYLNFLNSTQLEAFHGILRAYHYQPTTHHGTLLNLFEREINNFLTHIINNTKLALYRSGLTAQDYTSIINYLNQITESINTRLIRLSNFFNNYMSHNIITGYLNLQEPIENLSFVLQKFYVNPYNENDCLTIAELIYVVQAIGSNDYFTRPHIDETTLQRISRVVENTITMVVTPQVQEILSSSREIRYSNEATNCLRILLSILDHSTSLLTNESLIETIRSSNDEIRGVFVSINWRYRYLHRGFYKEWKTYEQEFQKKQKEAANATDNPAPPAPPASTDTSNSLAETTPLTTPPTTTERLITPDEAMNDPRKYRKMMEQQQRAAEAMIKQTKQFVEQQNAVPLNGFAAVAATTPPQVPVTPSQPHVPTPPTPPVSPTPKPQALPSTNPLPLEQHVFFSRMQGVGPGVGALEHPLHTLFRAFTQEARVCLQELSIWRFGFGDLNLPQLNVGAPPAPLPANPTTLPTAPIKPSLSSQLKPYGTMALKGLIGIILLEQIAHITHTYKTNPNLAQEQAHIFIGATFFSLPHTWRTILAGQKMPEFFSRAVTRIRPIAIAVAAYESARIVADAPDNLARFGQNIGLTWGTESETLGTIGTGLTTAIDYTIAVPFRAMSNSDSKHSTIARFDPALYRPELFISEWQWAATILDRWAHTELKHIRAAAQCANQGAYRKQLAQINQLLYFTNPVLAHDQTITTFVKNGNHIQEVTLAREALQTALLQGVFRFSQLIHVTPLLQKDQTYKYMVSFNLLPAHVDDKQRIVEQNPIFDSLYDLYHTAQTYGWVLLKQPQCEALWNIENRYMRPIKHTQAVTNTMAPLQTYLNNALRNAEHNVITSGNLQEYEQQLILKKDDHLPYKPRLSPFLRVFELVLTKNQGFIQQNNISLTEVMTEGYALLPHRKYGWVIVDNKGKLMLHHKHCVKLMKTFSTSYTAPLYSPFDLTERAKDQLNQYYTGFTTQFEKGVDPSQTKPASTFFTDPNLLTLQQENTTYQLRNRKGELETQTKTLAEMQAYLKQHTWEARNIVLIPSPRLTHAIFKQEWPQMVKEQPKLPEPTKPNKIETMLFPQKQDPYKLLFEKQVKPQSKSNLTKPLALKDLLLFQGK